MITVNTQQLSERVSSFEPFFTPVIKFIQENSILMVREHGFVTDVL